MKINEFKIPCDRCFNDIDTNKSVYKYGSAVYCSDCHNQIEIEILTEMAQEYFNSKTREEEKAIENQILNYPIPMRKEA